MLLHKAVRAEGENEKTACGSTEVIEERFVNTVIAILGLIAVKTQKSRDLLKRRYGSQVLELRVAQDANEGVITRAMRPC